MSIQDFFDYIKNTILSIGIMDITDILIVSIIIYYTIKFIKNKRAAKLLIGLFFLILSYFISILLEMNALNFILKNVFQVGIIALVILFQPEIRSVLENVASKSMSPINRIVEQKDSQKISNTINTLTEVAADLSESRTGALVVIERSTKLGDIANGISIKAEITTDLLKTIFFDKTPLHDGAVVISNNLIDSAGCYLPLSNSAEQLKGLGTRHRAGLGISEVSDAVVMIVSEETGTISLAVQGKLVKGFTETTLKAELSKLLTVPPNPKKQISAKKSKSS